MIKKIRNDNMSLSDDGIHLLNVLDKKIDFKKIFDDLIKEGYTLEQISYAISTKLNVDISFYCLERFSKP